VETGNNLNYWYSKSFSTATMDDI